MPAKRQLWLMAKRIRGSPFLFVNCIDKLSETTNWLKIGKVCEWNSKSSYARVSETTLTILKKQRYELCICQLVSTIFKALWVKSSRPPSLLWAFSVQSRSGWLCLPPKEGTLPLGEVKMVTLPPSHSKLRRDYYRVSVMFVLEAKRPRSSKFRRKMFFLFWLTVWILSSKEKLQYLFFFRNS